MRSLAANGEGVGISYTNPPGKFSYDGKPVHTARISDKEAVEPIILARSALEPPALEVRDIIATLKKMTVFRRAA